MEIPSRECYVLRIYRRDRDDPELVSGIVETVETQERKAIKSIDDIRNILLKAAEKKKE